MVRSLLHRSFVAPFQSVERVFGYAGGFLGTFGFTGALTYFSYDFAQFGPWALMAYFFGRLVIGGAFAMPVSLYLFYRCTKRRAYTILIGTQIATMGVISLYPEWMFSQNLGMIALVGLIFSFISAPFWSSFHLNMLCHTSDDNMGNEVSISSIVLFFGSTLAFLCAGVALTYMPGAMFVLVCFGFLIIGTIFFALAGRGRSIDHLQRKPFKIIASMRKNTSMVKATFMEGVFQFLTGFFAPVWMWAVGIKSLTMGMLMSFQGIAKLVISPLAGHLFHENKGRDVVLGAMLKPLGWIPWIFIQAPWVMLLSTSIWTLGQHLYSTGLGSRWYKERCLASQAGREMVLALGRIVTACLVVPVLYVYGPHVFFIVAFLATCCILLAALSLRKRERIPVSHGATHAQAAHHAPLAPSDSTPFPPP